jgi:hypothetical protein
MKGAHFGADEMQSDQHGDKRAPNTSRILTQNRYPLLLKPHLLAELSGQYEA